MEVLYDANGLLQYLNPIYDCARHRLVPNLLPGVKPTTVQRWSSPVGLFFAVERLGRTGHGTDPGHTAEARPCRLQKRGATIEARDGPVLQVAGTRLKRPSAVTATPTRSSSDVSDPTLSYPATDPRRRVGHSTPRQRTPARTVRRHMAPHSSTGPRTPSPFGKRYVPARNTLCGHRGCDGTGSSVQLGLPRSGPDATVPRLS